MSVLEVVRIEGSHIRVKGIDMIDGTPVLDIKPLVEKEEKDGSA
jgi:tRNA (Thr-GGU) A37 N-methylase